MHFKNAQYIEVKFKQNNFIFTQKYKRVFRLRVVVLRSKVQHVQYDTKKLQTIVQKKRDENKSKTKKKTRNIATGAKNSDKPQK